MIDLERAEECLRTFAGVLPELLKDKEVQELLYAAMAETDTGYDDYHVLWDKIADYRLRNSETVRERCKEICLRKGLAKGMAVFNSGLDSIEFLQVSIPVNFEKWDGKSPIPVTYVPLTINDSEVKELVFYYPGGKAEKVSVDTIPPDFPVMVVGINESFCSAADDSGETSLGKFTNSYFVHIEGIRIRKSQWRYEPWWKGKAEVYFRLYDYDAANAGSGNAANWVPFVGRYYPRGGNIFYRCWKWKRFRWRACHSWKTLSLNTEWNYNWFIPTSECNYCLRVMEYDPPFYDGGIDNGCFLVGVAGFVAGFESMNSNLPLSTLLGVGLGLLCKTVINDDYIGERQNFDDAVWWAYHNRGKYINGETIMGTSR